MSANSKLNVLVCPLGWGLGHASRNIPIIERLLAQGHNVFLAGDKLQLDYLNQFFPGLNPISFPSLQVRFCRFSSQLFPLLWVALRLPFYTLWEHFRLRNLIAEYSIDWVISDNRYGLWNRRVKSTIITHQLRVIPPYPFRWAMPVTEMLLRRWLKRFDWVWIPDTSNEPSIAGLLSKPNGLDNLHYIGTLSRFGRITDDAEFVGFDMVVVASGPEPQRTIFVDMASRLAINNRLNCLIIEGAPHNGMVPRSVDGVWLVGHLPDVQFVLAVKRARYLILRGGYSTIMDMLTLGVSGLLVPTPGQTEQEYLAAHLVATNLFRAAAQSELLNIDINDARQKPIDPEIWCSSSIDELLP